MKTNYHTHTTRCHHAVSTDEDYVRSAVKAGFTTLGFSDHSPWPYAGKYQRHIAMSVQELPDYLESIRALRKKYQEQIIIKIGLECEYFPQYIPWLRLMVEKEQLDYLIFGNHFPISDEFHPYYPHYFKAMAEQNKLEEAFQSYLNTSIEAMSSQLFACFAHPDLYMRSLPRFDDLCALYSRKLCVAAKEHNLILEYNLAGMLFNEERSVAGYPHDEFWKIACEVGNDIIIGYDAHNAQHLESTVYEERALTFLQAHNANIVTTLPMFASCSKH